MVVVISLLVLSPVAYGAKVPSASLTFSTIQNLSNNSGASTAPVVATVNYGGHQYTYVAWEDSSLGGRPQTFFRMSSDGGSTWNPVIAFTGLRGTASPRTSAVQIAAEGQCVFMTWQQGSASAFAASSDNGNSFTSGIISAGAPAGKMTGQALAATGSNVYFVWSDHETNGNGEIEFVVSHDGGKTLSSPVTISTGISGGPFNTRTNEVEVAAIGSYVYVVWDSIWFTVSSNTGATWSAPIQIRTTVCDIPCRAREPMISASGSNVYVTFPSDNTTIQGGSGDYHAYITVSHDNGQTFSGARDLNTLLTGTRDVQVASYGSNVYVTSRGMMKGTKGTQQFVYVSHDNGMTFSPPLLLASLSGPQSGFGGFAVDGSNVYVQWPHGSPSQMYVDSSQNTGVSWAGAQQVSSSTGGVVAMGDPSGGQGPMAAASNGHVCIVWEETSTGNGDIYFTSAPSL